MAIWDSPPPGDSFWKVVDKAGLQTQVYQRNVWAIGLGATTHDTQAGQVEAPHDGRRRPVRCDREREVGANVIVRDGG
ncbi:hypothetical protein [Bradyrhizobium sp. Ai1a-2]|uniref:hypothetical protein n=1 Tax=Bradyrhizobium sp. Ai1a-2 TaxID=196490 RepID=UPI0003FBE416|nr:hypothetical protein [Bradyrhizobium sp. Ai1a-2]